MKRARRRILVAVTLSECWTRPLACAIAGADVGTCDAKLARDVSYRRAAMPFCGAVVPYTPCVPKYQVLPPSREYPDGRFYNNTVFIKDAWVKAKYEQILANRKSIERSKTYKKYNHDENGMRGTVYPRFTKHKDCATAFKNIFCWMNFPRCNEQAESLSVCTSACQNFFRACNYDKAMWRCGPTEFFNGNAPEEPNKKIAVWLRDFFPGQPFRANRVDKNNNPIVLCTPSIKNSSRCRMPSFSFLVICILILFLVLEVK